MAGDPNMKSLTEIIAEQYVAEAEQGILDERAKAHRFRGWEKGRIYTHRRNPFPTLGRRVASFIFACLLAGTMAISVEAVCLPGGGFLTKTVENWIHVLFDRSDVTSAPTTIETVYLPTYLPEGYVLEKLDEGRSFVSTLWANASGLTLSLDQWIMSAQVMIEKDDTAKITLGDIQILRHRADGYYTFYWCAENYQFVLVAQEDISLLEIEKIINSLQIADET